MYTQLAVAQFGIKQCELRDSQIGFIKETPEAGKQLPDMSE